jgi:hypothetical protein
MPSFESERASLYGKPGDDRMLFVRNGRPAPEPQPDVAALLTQLIDGQAAINLRLDDLEAAQERRFAEAIDAARCADISVEDVRLLVDRTLIPAVRDLADHLCDIGDYLAYYAPDATITDISDADDSADNEEN